VISIKRATAKDCNAIVHIGRQAVELSHRHSCSIKDMNEYLDRHYNDEVIKEELRKENNIYHLLNYQDQTVGFSKIVLNAEHANIPEKNVTKLDRIYILEDFYNLKLGYHLLSFNIGISKENNQTGIWLFTWTGNEKAVNFYFRTGFEIIGSHKFKVTDTHYNSHHQMFLRFYQKDRV
jgi:ribosomal protein S18 acetylase RimI-like enzyme